MKQVIIIATVLLLPFGVNAWQDSTLREIADIPLGSHRYPGRYFGAISNINVYTNLCKIYNG